MKKSLNWISHSAVLLLFLFLLAQSQHFHHHGDSHLHEITSSQSCEDSHDHPIHRHDNTCQNIHHLTEDCSYCDWQQPLVNQSTIGIYVQQIDYFRDSYIDVLPNTRIKTALRANSNKAPPALFPINAG